MNSKQFHQENRGNQIKAIGAPQWLSQLFIRVFALATLLSLLVSALFVSPNEVSSEQRQQFEFGIDEVTNVFPTRVETETWAGVQDSLAHELQEDAVYQNFNARNAAYITPPDVVISTSSTAVPIGSVTPPEVFDDVHSDTERIDSSSPELIEDITDPAPLDESQAVPVSLFEIAPHADVFPLAQLSIISTTAPIVTADVGSEIAVEQVQSDTVDSAPSPASEVDEPVQNSLTSQDGAVQSLAEEVLLDTVSNSAVTSDDADRVATTTLPNGGSVEGTITTTSESETIPFVSPYANYHDITFANFATTDLLSGQFVTDIKLLMSFAAKLDTPVIDGPAPYVEILLNRGTETHSIGVVLIDNEVSNALNGGYFMFALPDDFEIAEFSDTSVTVRFYGEQDMVDGLFLDAVWLELETVTFDADDLRQRALDEQERYLALPQYSELLSEERNFTRTEVPLFHLRYNQQRNAFERFFARFISRQTVAVEQVLFVHKSLGELSIESDVTLTSDGLVSISVPDEELAKFQPGTYEVVVEYNESGLETVDRFDFQWGVLGLNPEKSEYEVGETATISLGALSQNGNTLCEADLQLFVTDPSGFISQVEVTPSGDCNGNNVTTVPDYTATFPIVLAGEYQLYLERLNEEGIVVSYMSDTVMAVDVQDLAISRNGPTRIYPKAQYTMRLSVETDQNFTGQIIERVPGDFVITDTDAEITVEGAWQVLTWDVSVTGVSTQSVQYSFDAPDISPYVYFLGAATLVSDTVEVDNVSSSVVQESLDSSVSSTTTSDVTDSAEIPILSSGGEDAVGTSSEPVGSVTSNEVEPEILTSGSRIVFIEHRQWQVASDAVGSMLLYWDGPTIPTGWTCVSCTGGDVFFQRFVMGSSTAGFDGGAATHTHTAVASVAATANTVTIGSGGANNYASVGHTHTLTPIIGSASNLPSYRNLVIIQNNSAGEPASIPAGAITMFDAAVPGGWTQYSAQNGFYLRGESIASLATTGGSNTHTHTITGTTGVGAGVANGAAGAVSVSNGPHTHSISSSTAPDSSEPPYLEMIIGKLNATSSLPNDAIVMWTEDAPTDWDLVSGLAGPLSNRFVKPAATYGATGGLTNHTPANVNNIVSSGPSGASNRGGAGQTRPSGTHTHLVNVTGFSNATHLPPFRTAVFAKRAGGLPPEAPIIESLFKYEKTGTSTPTLVFSGQDPVGVDSLLYQVQWDDDTNLDDAPIGSSTSNNETGCSPNCFQNIDSPGDTSPFNELESIQFTIQTPLTNNTTYYWRVRTKKDAGTTWSPWTALQSFTYVTDTDPSQWLVTTDGQFADGVFASTQVYGSDAVRILQDAPSEALVVYAEGTVQTPRYRIWDGAAWGSELSAQDVGGVIQWIRTVPGTIRDEYVMATQDANNDVNVQVFDGTTDTWGDLVEVTASISDNTGRGFDVAYETNSGDAIIVYCDGDSDPSYRVWNGSSWSIASSITTVSANNCEYVVLASDPISDEIIVVVRDTGALYEAQVWDGSTFGNSISGGSMINTEHEGIAVEYEESGNQAVVAVSNGSNANFLWTAWNGTEWTTAATQALQDDFEWGVMKRDVGTDNMVLCYIDQDAALGIVRWNGESWATAQEFEGDGGGNDFDGRPVSCEYEITSGRDGNIMLAYSDTANARTRFWNGTVISAETNISTIADSWEVGTVRTGTGLILAYFHDDINTQYDFSFWNGSVWSALQTLETTTSVGADPRRQPVHMTAKIYQPANGIYTSPQVDFDQVAGRPTWGEVAWTVVEPTGTDVTIQILYATTTATCNVPIPDGALPGNSSGFSATSSPLDLTSLSTSTYNMLCVKAVLETTNSNQPTLNDITVSWERQPLLVQSQYRWYANRNNLTPNDVWPVGVTDILQNESISQEYSPGNGQVLRLRMAVRSDNTTLNAGDRNFKLQYAESATECSAATNWFDVGDTGSSTALWRGYNNLLVIDGSTLSTLLLGTDVAASYEEENNSSNNPNAIPVGDEGEWDWVLEHNGANSNTQYCFRMVTGAGAVFGEYEQYPMLVTNATPEAPSLEKLFDNEQVASTTPWFEFVSEDLEGNEVTYQVQVDNNFDFSSPTIDRNSEDNFSEFENIVTIADKDPFTIGQTVRFKPSSSLTNGITYYWRVRAIDGAGSNTWGDWSTVQSFTVNTGTIITAWYQTEQEQFDTNDFENTETTTGEDVILSTGFTVGSTTSSVIDFDDRTTGNAWGVLSWVDVETLGTISYQVEYFNGLEWVLVPDSFLSGNSVGFGTSPISLLSLDPEVHNEIRIRANLVETTGTPRLQSWTVEWGLAVEQPTKITPFDNEKVGTTTPALRFFSNDPDVDDLQYEVSWSTDNTFSAGTTTVLSGVSSGFINTETGGDSSPFNSGEVIQYQLQAAQALTDGQTYWWRVRARDPLGGNTWSVWSNPVSLTVDTAIDVSTWFQTTDEQFGTDSLNDVEVTGADSVEIASIIREAMFAYAEGTVQVPRYRLWNGTVWGSEQSAVSVGGSIRFVEAAASEARNEYIIATQEATGRVRAQVYDGNTATFGDLDTIITAVPSLTSRGFDVAYESLSGDALVVACDGTEATYKVWNGTSWSSATAITLAVTANCNWIRLAADPVSDEIVMVVRDAITGATDYQALVWSGSAWGNSLTIGSASEAANEGIAVEYEESGDRAVVVVSNGGAASFAWNSWNGSAWTGNLTQALQDDFEVGRLNRDFGTDNLALCSIDNDGQVAVVRWSGSTNSWNAFQTIDTAIDTKIGRRVDCIFENTSGRDGYIMVPYSDVTNARYRAWDGTTLSAEASISTIQDVFEVRAARAGDDSILAVFYDDVNTQYDFSYWNGSTWSTIETLEGTSILTTVPATVPIDIVARKYPTFTSGSVISTPIDFDDGSGLKWQQFTFSNTTPGASEITYQLEYLNGDTWAVIPNSALSGNETGFTTSPVDISSLSRITHNEIRLRANLECILGDCPTLNDWSVTWAEGINVSGSAFEYNQTSSTTVGTVAIAVNGSLQVGKTGTISNGAWTIPNVTAFESDIITVFVTGAADADEAVAVTRYDGDGDITNLVLNERHLTLGSNDATTTPLTNANIGLYDVTSTEDVFFDVNGTTLTMCADAACSDVRLLVRSGTYFTPTGRFVAHDFQNNGFFTAGSFTHEINGSWDNNASANLTNSTIVFAATSTTESLDSTGASLGSFSNVQFGTTTGAATFTLASILDVDGALTVSRGTLSRATTSITVAGSLLTTTNGFWTGIGTTTFDGNTAITWRDQNAVLQNVGHVVIDGTSKAVTLASNVAAQSITIGANDTLDASTSNFDITVYGSWVNQNNFIPRQGEVFFAATSSGQTITTAGDSFYDLSFTGIAGTWSFIESAVTVGNNLRFLAGATTLPTGTTTVAGSFDATGGSFLNNNGTIAFTSNGPETIIFDGDAFTNVASNLAFTGAGGMWTMSDTHATATNIVHIAQGTVTFPSGTFAIGGSIADVGGAFNGNNGTVRMYSSTLATITSGGSSFANLTFDGTGSFSFTDTTAIALGDVSMVQGTTTLPTGTFTIGGSYANDALVLAGTGTVTFNSADVGETIATGLSTLHNITFNSTTGGWTITESATTTGNVSLTAVSNWTLGSGQTLSVAGTFANAVANASTTWSGTTLSLEGGSYTINAKSNGGDSYGTLRVASGAAIKMWNSTSTLYEVSPSGYLYSQDHNGVNGDLYIWGTYVRTSGTEYWSYDTDFDGTSLTGGGERQVNVRFASSSAQFENVTVEIEGVEVASTTIAREGNEAYTVVVSDGTLRASYYEFTDVGGTGLALVNGVLVTTLDNGSFAVDDASATAITLSSTTVDANPAKQIFNVRFATSTAISANNVTQTDGTPVSYWWFRDGGGNLYGEAYDNDTGNPGSVRFDDSSIQLTISGTVYSDAGVTPITGGTCNGAAQSVRLLVNGASATTTSCSAVDGSYAFVGLAVTGDPTITVYLDNASGGQRAAAITRTPTVDISDFNLFTNRVIVRNEDTAPLTITQLAVYDGTDDSDLRFFAATSTSGDTLVVQSGTELFVASSSVFTPGGAVTLSGNAGSNSYDGTLYIDDGGTFNAFGTSTLTIGGRLVLDAGALFSAASTTVLMNATTTGKSITSASPLTFHELVFDGSGGGWNLGANISVNAAMEVLAGTVSGTGNITIPTGTLTGNGILSLGGGTTTLGSTNSLGGTTPWTFYNLQLGDGSTIGTTTPLFTATTTISSVLTIAGAHYLDAGTSMWDLAGSGTVFVETGTFLEDTSTIRYSGNSANIRATQYYNLDINAGAGTPTYTATGLGLAVLNTLSVGGAAPTTFTLNTNDPLLDVDGDVIIQTNGTLVASDTGSFTIAGNYTNDGTFTGSGGTVVFDGSGNAVIAAGASPFSSVRIAGSGNVTVSEHATATAAWRLQSAATFTVATGHVLAVGGTYFSNLIDGGTTWTGATLRLYGGGDYAINAATSSESFSSLFVADTTQIRMWGSSASTYSIEPTASLYSQDHAGTDGDLYIWGAYRKTVANDFWTHDYDFDGTVLGGGARKVDVYLADNASVMVTGGSFLVQGSGTASTTIQSAGSGTYALTIGGTASTSLQYYEVRDGNSSGLVLTGTPAIGTLSSGDFEVSQNGGSAITVGGTVLTQNPAKTMIGNHFALDGVAGGFNVTATGTALSSWRFTNYTGDIAGETFDTDPDGDPGYLVWDDSAASITISGRVYSDEGVTVPAVCNGSTQSVRLVVAGAPVTTASCASGTGIFSFVGVDYLAGDSIIVYLTGASSLQGATVTFDPVSNINNLDIYANRVIVRHENTDPITIDDLAVYDSSDDANIPFTAVSGSPDSLSLPADRKLIVWTGKSFAPGGNVTVTNGGSQAYGGTIELQSSAVWTGQGTEEISVGGSFTLGTSAVFTSSNGTTSFTTTGTGRTIDVNEYSFGNVAFTGSGSWSITDPTITSNGYIRKTAGTLMLPTGTTTVAGSFVNSGGTFDANGGNMIVTGTGSHVLTLNGSSLNTLIVQSGSYVMTDTAATATASVTIQSGSLTLPSGTFTVGGNFANLGGSVTHNTSELYFTNAIAATLLASSSDLSAVTFAGGGTYTMVDNSLTLLDSVRILSGSLTLPSTTLAVGGSFIASGGTFAAASSTVLFNSADTGEVINPGLSSFNNVVIGAPSGGYSITANATTTNNFSITGATNFTLTSGSVLSVGGVFQNTVGGGNTTWTGSTLALMGGNAYTVNTKSSGGDQYATMIVGPNSDIRMWNSAATAIVDVTSSLYSQDNNATDGSLFVYGDFHVGTTTEYWSYATDFDGTTLGGSPRAVTVAFAANATTTVDGGALYITGTAANETVMTNQGSGVYSLEVSDGVFSGLYFEFRNLNTTGLVLTGEPTISSLSYGDFELAVNGGSLITLSSTTLNANASLLSVGNRFATTTTITGTNVTLIGDTLNAWTFSSHTGNLDGEEYDSDGISLCGSVRWDDSSCLLTQQTQYRWRNDDGGLNVPAVEWWSGDWGARKRVRVVNADAQGYTDMTAQLFVSYDSDMQADFDDLRFTESDGVTVVPHWVGSTTNSTVAEVWVQVPSLPADSTATLFMYYGNPTATTSSDITATFIAGDDFEDGDIAEYSGQSSLFTDDTSFAFDGTYGLSNDGFELSRANLGGIYRTDQTISQGETIRFVQYVDTSAGSGDEVCTKFAVQTPGSSNDNYAICLEQFGTDRISLVRDVVDNDSSGTIIASSTVSYTTGWYTVEVDWGVDDSIAVVLYSPSGSSVASFSVTDGTYISGGYGFTYWFHNGGWDGITSRLTVDTEPLILFGVEQTEGGATWKAAQNTAASYDVSDVARLRILVENTGLPITDQEFLLEYAPLGAAPSCEAVNPNNYDPVPSQASCGTESICLVDTTQFTNGDSTVDLLDVDDNLFTPGEARENPTNTTGPIDVDQGYYTEIEYAITPTINVDDENYCFRVTDAGDVFDSYLRVARLSLQFDPTLTNVTLNGGQSISLLPGTTTRVYATSTATDLNGILDFALATTTFYRSGVGALCTADNNNCYVATSSQCSFVDCGLTSCTLSCYADMFFHADATATGTYAGEEWFAFMELEDQASGYDFETSIGQELETLRAISVTGDIDYGALAVNADTGAYNATTSILNLGNVEVDIEVVGTDLSDGLSSFIPASQQKFATTTFTYTACGISCELLSSTSPVTLDVELTKPTVATPPVTDTVYWGIAVPIGVNSVPHQGYNVFTPISP